MRPNPILPGFNPDPSIVLVNGRYYLATSTFEYLPGIALYESIDLARWRPIGHVITRPEQADLSQVPTPGGAWAPTIRHRDGVFFVIVSLMFGSRGCVVYTATDPSGPWSDGVELPAVDGLDPDLAWDVDGTAYVTFAKMGAGIRQIAVDLRTGAALEEVTRPLWSGTGLHAPEGPHLYRRGETWYLLVAEGGTERGHAISIARSDSPRGPFIGDPSNPLLSARSTASPVQNVGHADIVDKLDGTTAMVMLGVRPVGFTRSFSPLGRETFLVDASWEDGWLRATLPRVDAAQDLAAVSIDFTEPGFCLDAGWIAVRRQPHDVIDAHTSGEPLRLTASGSSLSDLMPTFLGRRQTDLSAMMSTHLDVARGVGGLAARHTERHWFALEAESDGEGIAVTARAALANMDVTWRGHLSGSRLVQLRIESASPPSDADAAEALAVGGDQIRLFAANDHEEILLAELDGRYWSFETTESFTGRVVGIYAASGTVDFHRFTYRGTRP